MDATNTKSRPHYDVPTAVTFLIAGLGIGSVLTMLLASVSGQSKSAVKSTIGSTSAEQVVL